MPAQALAREQERELEAAMDADEVVLWFARDLFCELSLLYVLTSDRHGPPAPHCPPAARPARRLGYAGVPVLRRADAGGGRRPPRRAAPRSGTPSSRRRWPRGKRSRRRRRSASTPSRLGRRRVRRPGAQAAGPIPGARRRARCDGARGAARARRRARADRRGPRGVGAALSRLRLDGSPGRRPSSLRWRAGPGRSSSGPCEGFSITLAGRAVLVEGADRARSPRRNGWIGGVCLAPDALWRYDAGAAACTRRPDVP